MNHPSEWARFYDERTGRYHPVNKTHINAIRIWVSDRRNNILDLNGINLALSLMIEEV